MKFATQVKETYYLNEIKQTVVCVIEAIITKAAPPAWSNNEDLYVTKEKVKFVGKAKCGPKDEFDHLIGRKIASSRARIKMLKRAQKEAEYYYKVCKRRAIAAKTRADIYKSTIINEQERIAEHM